MKKFISTITTLMVIVAIMATLAVPAMAAFADVPSNHWASNYINYAEMNKIISGMGDGTFQPDATLTEAQCTQIIYNMRGGGYNVTVSSSDPWYTAAAKFVESRCGIIINPMATASRELVCRLIYQCEKDNPRAMTPGEGIFADCNWLSRDSQYAIRWCIANGIVYGYEDNTFRPSDGLTRAQGAKVFSIMHRNLIEYSAPESIKQRTDLAAESMVSYSKSLGLQTEITDRWYSGTNNSEYWVKITVSATNDSYYTIICGGTTDVLWYYKQNNDLQLTTEDGLKGWLKGLASSFSIKERTLIEVNRVKAYAESKGLYTQLKDWPSSDSEYFWQGLIIDSTTFVCGGKNKLAWYERRNSESIAITESELTIRIDNMAKSGNNTSSQMERSIQLFMNTAKTNGLYSESSIRSDKEWADLTVYTPAGTYKFIVGTQHDWWNSSGRMESMTEDAVMAWLKNQAFSASEKHSYNVTLVTSLIDEKGLIPIISALQSSTQVSIYGTEWSYKIATNEGGDLRVVRDQTAQLLNKLGYNKATQLAAGYFKGIAERYNYKVITEGDWPANTGEYWYGVKLENRSGTRTYQLIFGGIQNGIITFYRSVGDGMTQYTRTQLETELYDHR